MGKTRSLLMAGAVFAAACVAQKYTPQGEFILPDDYREWIFLTSDLGMTYSDHVNAHPAFGNVFVNPAAYRAFVKTGSWPDKTVLIIENRASEKSPLGKDEGKYQTQTAGFEAHVKDSSHGGWAFYLVRPGARMGERIADRKACADCHEQHAATDTTFVQFYPTLIDAAKKSGTYKEPRY